jgi:hypothetical protein
MSSTKARIRPARPPRGSIGRIMGLVALAGLFAVACDDVTGPEQLDTLTLTPATSTVEPTATVPLTAIGTRAGMDVTNLVGETYAVTSGGGTVSATGVFTAPSTPGTSTITVTCANLTATATVTVTAGPLATITVTPDPVTLAIGETQQFTAVGRDAFDNIVDITPVWSATNPPGTIDASTGMFTAGNTTGTFENSVRATSGSIFGTATVTVVAGPLATITVTPNPVTLETGAQQQFTAVGRDAGGNVVAINPVWSTTNPPGTINASTGLFTAGNTTGVFNNSVTATDGSMSGSATVTVTAPVVLPPPLPAEGVRMIARVAWTCSDGSIDGSVATNQGPGEVPPGSVTQTECPISGDIEIGTPEAKQAYQDFLDAYAVREATACGTTLTGTLDGQILAPGVYCFDNAATLTGELTLSGPATGEWLFKIGAAGIPGGLTGTDFDVVMAGDASACNVSWWVREASTMTTSNFQGHILAGAGVSFTEGTYKGNAWSQEDVTVTGTAVTPCDAP